MQFRTDMQSIGSAISGFFSSASDEIAASMERMKRDTAAGFAWVYNWLKTNGPGIAQAAAAPFNLDQWIPNTDGTATSSARGLFSVIQAIRNGPSGGAWGRIPRWSVSGADEQFQNELQRNLRSNSALSGSLDMSGAANSSLDNLINDPVLNALNSADRGIDGLRSRLSAVSSKRSELINQYFDTDAQSGKISWRTTGAAGDLTSAQRSAVLSQLSDYNAAQSSLSTQVGAAEKAAEAAKRAADQAQQFAKDIQRKQTEDLRRSQDAVNGAVSGPYGELQRNVRSATSVVNPQTGLAQPMQADPATIANYQQAYQQQLTKVAQNALEETSRLQEQQAQRSAEELLRIQKDSADKNYQFQLQDLEREEQAQLKSLDSVDAQTLQQKQAVAAAKYQVEVQYQDKVQALEIQRLRTSAQLELNQSRLKVANGSMTEDQYASLADAVNAGLVNQTNDILAGSDYKKQDSLATYQTTSKNLAVDQYKQTFDTISNLATQFFDKLTDKTKSFWQSVQDAIKSAFTNILKGLVVNSIAGAFTHAILGYGPSDGTGGATVAGGRRGGFASLFAGLLGGGGGGFAAGFPGAPGGTSGTFGPVILGGGGGYSGGGSWDYSAGGNLTTNGGGSGDFTIPTRGSGTAIPGLASIIGPGGTAGFAQGSVGGSGSGEGIFGQLSKGGLSGIWSQLWGSDPMAHAHGGPPTWDPTTGQEKYPDGTVGPNNPDFGAPGANLALTAGGMMFMRGISTPGTGLSQGINRIGGGAAMGYGIANKIGMNPLLGAAAGAGIGMVDDAHNRGGVGGAFEGLGGGAIAGASIGLQYGGPVGAAIGAGVGAITGLFVGLFGQNKIQEVKNDVKRAYGVNIEDSTAQWILQLANQSYGGSIPTAISSAEVRRALQGLAQATGQGNGYQIAGSVTPYTVADSGGQVSNIQPLLDGQAAGSYGGALPTLSAGLTPGQSSSSSGLGSSPSSPTLFQFDGPATTALFTGQIASGAPGAVSNSLLASNNRIGTYATLANPGVISGPPA